VRRGAIGTLRCAALLLALGAAGCGAAARSPAPPTHAAIGLSDEDPAAFANPHFHLLRQRLHIRLARLITAFDSASRLPAWLSAAQAAGLQAYVTLGGDNSCNNPVGTIPPTGDCPPPSDAAYASGFKSLIRAAPGVHDWGAWSEPSNYVYYPCATPAGSPPPAARACGQARLGAVQAARYWLDAVAADRALGRHDTIVAGETGADCTAPAFNLCPNPGAHGWSGYVPAYLAALGGARPAVWGTNSYHDLQLSPALAATDTNRFTQFVNAEAGAPEIWLTEEGLWLGGRNGAALNGKPQAQRKGAREFLDLPLVPAAHWRQIAREYYYLLRAKPGAGFDSALLDLNGVPRPAFCVLTGEPASRCPGDPTQHPP
jgi:hypothetical protein